MKNENRRARVFVYRDVLGILASLESPGLINNPAEKNQMGFIFQASEVLFSSSAISWLKRVERGPDDLGVVNVSHDVDGNIIFSWLGGPRRAIMSVDAASASNYYNADGLIASDPVEIPDSFIRFVDRALARTE